jgi:AraC-like DNA-binding protein
MPAAAPIAASFAPFDPLAELDRLIYFSEEPVDVDAARRLLEVDADEDPPSYCAAFDFPQLTGDRHGEVIAWSTTGAAPPLTGFRRTRALAALPSVVYWFGWRTPKSTPSPGAWARHMVRLAGTAEAAGLPRPAIGLSHAIADWVDVRRALTRATVGFRLAQLEGRPYGTAEEVERYLAAPRTAPRSTAALVNGVARGDVELVRNEASKVVESFTRAYISPLATLRTRLLELMLACGEAARSTGLTEHVVTRWADHRLRQFWRAYSLPLLASTAVECLVELTGTVAAATSTDLPRAVAGAKSLLAATWNENYPAAYVAREVGVSVGQLSRLFRRAMGCSIPQYRNRIRIERAAELLRTTDKSVTTVALDCGFTNLTHFHRVFSRVHGRSPREYRTDGE